MKTPLTAREGLNALVTWALDNRYCSTADLIRSFLLSLYNGSENKCDLSGIQLLDSTQRRALTALLIGIGRDGLGNVYDHEIRETFALAGGEAGLRWFMEPNGKLEDDLVKHFMSGAAGGRLRGEAGPKRPLPAAHSFTSRLGGSV